jgi:hypothetical protein
LTIQKPAILLLGLLAIFLHAPSFAQGIDVANWFGPDIGKRTFLTQYSLDIYANADVDRQDTDLGLLEHNFFLLASVWQNERNECAIMAQVELQDTDTDALLPREGIPLPSQLWEVRVGGIYRGVVRGNWIWGVTASFGSASNEPFQAEDAFDGTLGGLLRIPHKKRNAWLFFLYFATNREFLNYIPLPAGGYWWEPSDKFRAVVGVPFASFKYKPIEKLSLDLGYFPVRNIHAKATYSPARYLNVFVGFDWRNQRYYRADRDRNDDRIFYYEKRAGGGLRLGVAKQVAITFQAGYAFDRLYFEAKDYNDRDGNIINIVDTPYGTVKIGARF